MNIFGITGQYLELLQMAEDGSLDQDMINDTQDPKLDRTAIKKFLKDNEVSWAHLQQGESLRIR